jgi:hypothetical protein
MIDLLEPSLEWRAAGRRRPENQAPVPQAYTRGVDGPTVTALLEDGPLRGRTLDVATVEGRPPKTIDVPADDGGSFRYCLTHWEQSGPTADYSFLYQV